jgi:hypothetical protein
MRRRHPVLIISAIAVLLGLFAVRGSVAGRPPRSPLLTATIPPSLPQNFLPLIMKIPSPTPTSTPISTATAITPPAPPTATPSVPTATLPAVTPFCAGEANVNAPNTPIAITNVNKVGETVTIHNVSAGTIDLDGWWICSMLGHQLHAVLSGTIAPGQSLIIPTSSRARLASPSGITPVPIRLHSTAAMGSRLAIARSSHAGDGRVVQPRTHRRGHRGG